MRRRTRTIGALSAGALLLTCAWASSASATFHQMRIRAVFEGPVAHSAFVELQMTMAGQNLTAGHKISFYDHTGTLVHSSPPFTNVAFGDNQRTILVGDTAAIGSPDFIDGTMRSMMMADAMGGAVCYENIDCFAWGPSFTGGALLPSPAGTPVSGLSTTQVSVRNISANCPTLLENADDTDNSAADFNYVTGFPVRNNSVAPTEVACPPPSNNPTSTSSKPKCKKAKRHSANAAKKHKKCKKPKKKH